MGSLLNLKRITAKQDRVMKIFEDIKSTLTALGEEIQDTEPKTAEFLKSLAEGGFKSVMQHYMLESRSNLRKASEEIQIDDILASVNKESVSKEAMIVTLKKAPDA